MSWGYWEAWSVVSTAGQFLLNQARSYAQTSYPQSDTVQIEPLTALVQLALLGLVDELNTKVRIDGRKHKLIIQKPSRMQGFVRTLCQDSHDDLNILEKLIKRAAQIHHPEQNESVRSIFLAAQDGLKSLKKTYEKKPCNTAAALENWSTLVNKACVEGISFEKNESIPDKTKILMEIWDNEEINRLANSIKIAKGHKLQGENSELELELEIKNIESILNGKRILWKEKNQMLSTKW